MFDQCIYFNLNKVTRKINKIWDQAFLKHGLSPAHGYALLAIGKNEQVSSKQLAEQLQLDLSTVSRFTDILISQKLIKKTQSKEDKRSSYLSLTKMGEKKFLDLNKVTSELFKKVRKDFNGQLVSNLVDNCKELEEKIQNV